jgi:hypothetical protein
MHHPVQTAAAVAAALVALAFGLSTFERWLAGHRRHELAWSAALAMFAVAAGALAAGAQGGWSGPVFRVFYLFGAIVNVPVLALGTTYLVAGQRRGDQAAALVAVGAAFAAGVVVTTPFTHALPPDQLAQGSRVFGPLPRILAAVSSGGAATVIFAGAAWSAWRWRRGRSTTSDGENGNRPGRGLSASRLAFSNLLIALGTLVLSASGLLNSVVGAMTGFSVTLLVGISVIFAGFLATSTGRAIAPAAPWWPPATLSLRPPEAGGAPGGAASRPGRAEATSRS